MKLKHIKDHVSIKYFEPIELPSLAVLTGLNGSGKTHLLEAIKGGNIEIEGIDKSEIVYYNYNDFSVFTGNPQQNPFYNNRTNNWNKERELLIQRFNQTKQRVALQFQPLLASSGNNIIYSFIQTAGYNFEKWFGNIKDYESFEELKKEQNVKAQLASYSNHFTPQFFSFLNSYLVTNNGNIEDVKYELLKQRFETISVELERALRKDNEEFYNFITKNFDNRSVFTLSQNDFETPNFFLEEIANEEKEYQFLKTKNSLDKLSAIDWNEEISYLEKNQFIEKYGLSPVERINEVLSEYDCNGYCLATNKFQAQLGIDKTKMSIQINLKQPVAGYQTTFDRLSSGEKTLIALSLLIYKSRKKKIIPRVLLLDEIDSSLHPSMIKRLLNVITELFIKREGLKVILATHSPTTVALSPDSSIFVVDKVDSKRIYKQEKENAISLLTEGFATLNSDDSNLSIQYNISKTDLPILFTEGITDKIIIETAWKKINGQLPMPFYVQDCFDASFLANLFKRGYDKQDGIFINHPTKKLIALFDFDNQGYNAWNSLGKLSTLLESDPTKSLTKQNEEKNGYAILLPVPKNSVIRKQVIKSNDETFKDESLLTIELLFYGVEELKSYFKTEKTIGGGEVVSFAGSKRDFANKLAQLKGQDFEGLKPLFGKLNEIVSKANSIPTNSNLTAP